MIIYSLKFDLNKELWIAIYRIKNWISFNLYEGIFSIWTFHINLEWLYTLWNLIWTRNIELKYMDSKLIQDPCSEFLFRILVQAFVQVKLGQVHYLYCFFYYIWIVILSVKFDLNKELWIKMYRIKTCLEFLFRILVQNSCTEILFRILVQKSCSEFLYRNLVQDSYSGFLFRLS